MYWIAMMNDNDVSRQWKKEGTWVRFFALLIFSDCALGLSTSLISVIQKSRRECSGQLSTASWVMGFSFAWG